MMTDIEIAQSTQMKPIQEIAETAGVPEEYLEYYGRYKAKVDYKLLNEIQAEDGKLILVTAITPTPAGEGKTTTSVGLADGLRKIGKKSIAALREPSWGRCSASKGEPPAAGTPRWSPWRTSTSTSPATSTPSVRQQSAGRHAGQPYSAG